METNLTSNKSLLDWLDEKVELLKPSNIVWIDGSKEQIDALKKEAVETGEMIKLNDELLPDCYLHRTAENDVARVEDRTLICTTKEEDAGPTNHWMAPDKCYKMLYDIAVGSYEGRTMYIIPYSMGPVGSPMSKIGIEITDSIYVVLNMNIMTRIGKKVLDTLGDSNDWVRGMHCKCDVDPEKRWICQFPEDNTIISVNSAYGGNVLLGKKCFALRIASYLAIRDVDIPEDAFKGIEAIIQSMTPKERTNPSILNTSRRQRIAKGSGTNIQEVNKLIKQFEQTRKMMQMMTGNKMAQMMGRMKGMPGMPKMPGM